MAIITKSTLTCPVCGFQKTEEMATNSCQYFWQCPDCENIIKPENGDCCVFCSYGDVACPTVQDGNSCCS